jgi:hypothetical protein
MQQKKSATTDSQNSTTNTEEDRAINERLLDVIRANAVKADADSTVRQRRKLSYFETVRAGFGLIGLMFVGYIFNLLIKKEA